MSEIISVNSHIIEAAKTIKGCNDRQIKHFVAASDFAVNELILQLKKAWPEILRIAAKVGEDGKAEIGKMSFALEFDVSNLDLLKVDISSSVTPWKLSQSSNIENDLNQIQLDFANATITRSESSEPDGETGNESAGSVDYDGMELDELKKLAKSREIKVTKSSTSEDLIDALKFQDAGEGEAQDDHGGKVVHIAA